MDDITDKSSEELFLVVHLNNKSNTGTDSTDSDTINNKSISTASTTTVNKSKIMGVENTWNEEENFFVPTAADFPIPLPPPPVGFDDLSTAGCPVDVVESGTLEVLFSTNEDQENQTDHLIIDDIGNGDISDGDSEAGVCGLRNLGNTCFMSTGVQCLVATPSLIRCLLDKTILDSDATVSSDSLTAQLAALTNKMWSGHYSSVQPADFKHSLGTLYPQFKDFRQHDCQEFLALLLDGLHEQMNCANGKISTLVNSNNNNSFETAGDSDDTNCDINKQKLDCGSNVQCSGCWSPKKEFLDFNNYNYNNNNNNNCNSASNSNSHNSVIKKELNGYKDKTGFTKMPSSSSSTSAQAISMPADSSLCSDLDKDANKINDSVLCATNNNNKINDICSSNGSDNIVSNNSDVSMSDNYESSKTNRDELDLNGDTEHNHWYNGSCLTGIQDIMKDAKTSNVNVLVTEQEINNEIRFDSDKFPKNENSLRRKETLNFNAFHIYDNNTGNNTNSGKRVKSTVTHYNCVSDFREGLDLKRIKMHRFECDDYEKDKNIIMEYQNNKSKTIDINLVEKNLRIECERKQRELDGSVNPVDLMNVVSDAVAGASGGCSSFFVANGSHVPQNDKNHIGTISSTSSDGNFFNSVGDDDDDREGDTHWEKHLATNQSIIVDTFQGQFKSTVVCSACKYVSVTYEPFMYLSVPLPHAMERQICVTFIPNDPHCNSVQYLVTLNKRDKISKLKEQLIHLLNSNEIKGSSIILAEVFDNHIAKILNDNHLIRYVDDINRHIYAFELLSLNTIAAALNENMAVDSVDGKNSPDSNINIGPQNVGDGNAYDSEDWSYNEGCGNSAYDDQQMTPSKSCIICLEEKESNMMRHVGCNCVLCDLCVKSSFQHYGGDTLICPVCRAKLNPDTDLVPVTNDVPSHPVVRMFMVPIVYRIDMLGDGNNNKKTVKLFGHPNVVRLRNNISSDELYKIMSYIVPYAEPYKILLVDGQGRHCSRCMFNEHCRGCAVNIHNGPLNLTTGDTLAVTFVRSVEELLVKRHSSLSAYRSQQSLTLYDCIQAFSQSEVLDKQNPWYCPECKQNQCATKTLSVWRCPDYLIVYLKRFVYQDGMSTKLEDKVMFPFHGLNLITSVSYSTVYDLYACVCHVGGVSAGHYTAYTQHPKTGEWHYYNDDVVAKQMPQEEDYSNAYILFYRKRGLTGRDTGVADNDNGEGCSSYNTI